MRSKLRIRPNCNLAAMCVAIGLCMASCYTPVEGCLDPEATNYAIEADNDCDDCCVYPIVNLNIFHQNGEETLDLGDTLTNDQGQRYIIADFGYLLSDFTISTATEDIRVDDLITVETTVGSVSVPDDIINVDRGTFSYQIGSAVYNEASTSLLFRVGLTEIVNENPLLDPPENHPLVVDRDSLFSADLSAYISQRILVIQGSALSDTVIYDIPASVMIDLPVESESLRGQDKTIIIEADYAMWFRDVDFEEEAYSIIVSKVTDNTKDIFSVR